MTSNIETMITECLEQLQTAKNGECSPDRAERNAAAFLTAQLQLIDLLADIELKSKMSRNEIERTEAEKYFEIKNGNQSDKKLTEVALGHAVVKDEKVLSIKQENAEHEVNFKKYQYLLNTLKDGHIYFRALSKRNEF